MLVVPIASAQSLELHDNIPAKPEFLSFDEFEKLDLRFAPAGGFGYKALATERITMRLFGGPPLNREFFSTGLHRTSGEVLFGEEIAFKDSSLGSLNQKLSVFPNATHLLQSSGESVGKLLMPSRTCERMAEM